MRVYMVVGRRARSPKKYVARAKWFVESATCAGRERGHEDKEDEAEETRKQPSDGSVRKMAPNKNPTNRAARQMHPSLMMCVCVACACVCVLAHASLLVFAQLGCKLYKGALVGRFHLTALLRVFAQGACMLHACCSSLLVRSGYIYIVHRCAVG